LRGISPAPEQDRKSPSRPFSMWWASSITGVAAVVAIIAVINMQQPEPESMTDPAVLPLALPFVKWQTKTAVLTGPLQQEYEDLQADLKKAEQALRDDIGL